MARCWMGDPRVDHPAPETDDPPSDRSRSVPGPRGPHAAERTADALSDRPGTDTTD